MEDKSLFGFALFGAAVFQELAGHRGRTGAGKKRGLVSKLIQQFQAASFAGLRLGRTNIQISGGGKLLKAPGGESIQRARILY